MRAGKLAEVLSVDDSLAQFRRLAACLGIVGELVEHDEDVAGTGLPDHLAFASALLDELHEMETARAADGLADVSDLELQDGVGEDGGERGGLSPPEVAPFERLLPVGMGHRHVREVRSGPQLAEHALGPCPRPRDLLGRRAVGNRDQDVPDAKSMPVRLGAATLHHGEIVVDIALRDIDLVLDPEFAHIRDHDFVPDLFAKLREVVAVAFQGVPELAQREFVLLREAEQRLVEPLVVDAYGGIARELELEPDQDQPFEHASAQRAGRRGSRAGLTKLLARPFQMGFQLARSDDVVIDDGDDAIEIGAERALDREARGARPADCAGDNARRPSPSD